MQMASTIYSLLLNCSFPVYMCSSIRIMNLCSHGKQLYQLEYNAYVQFLFLSVLQIHFQSYSFPKLLRSAPFPPLPLKRLFHTSVIQLDPLVTVYFSSWVISPSKRFFKNSYYSHAIEWRLVSVPYSPIHMLKPNPQCDAMWGWDL